MDDRFKRVIIRNVQLAGPKQTFVNDLETLRVVQLALIALAASVDTRRLLGRAWN
jgi:hypothetical protein